MIDLTAHARVGVGVQDLSIPRLTDLLGPVAAEPKRALKVEAGAWENARNNKRAKADWQFVAADARVKLKRLAVDLPEYDPEIGIETYLANVAACLTQLSQLGEKIE